MNDRGLTLIEVMIGSTVAALAIGVVGYLITTSSRAQRALHGRADFAQLSDGLSLIIDDPELCKIAFWDASSQIATFNPDASTTQDKLLTSVKLRSSTLISVGMDWNTIKVKQLELSEIDPTYRRNCPTSTIYLATLVVAAAKQRAMNDGGLKLGFPFYLAASRQDSRIVGCGRKPPACL